jgi:hypothetical protein
VTIAGSVNGSRTRGNNYQIDGADNNDAFQNASAVNQGGVPGIAGTLLPVEAIDQFSVQSGASAEIGQEQRRRGQPGDQVGRRTTAPRQHSTTSIRKRVLPPRPRRWRRQAAVRSEDS